MLVRFDAMQETILGLSGIFLLLFILLTITSKPKVKIDAAPVITKKHAIPLLAWFAFLYILGIVGGFVSQSSNEFNFAALINIFLYPSFASALTITFSIFSYRKYSARLANLKNRFALGLFIAFICFVLWWILAYLLVVLIN